MNAVILSNQVQYERFVRETPDWESYKIYCDNPGFYKYLEQKQNVFERLDEFAIKNSWSEINAAGCTMTSRWMAIARESRIFDDLDIPSALYLFVSYLLIHGLENYFFAKSV